MKTVVKIKFGSHLYGTSTPASDVDYKSVHIPSAKDILLQKAAGSVSRSASKDPSEKNKPGDVDDESYSLQRFLDLAMSGQTVAIDMLFAPKECIVGSSRVWKEIQANTHLLLSKKSAAFIGYCRAQANKYGVKGSRVAAAKRAMDFFEAVIPCYGPTTKVGDFHDSLATLQDEHTSLVELPLGSSGEMGWFFECCNRKLSFTADIKFAHEMFKKLYESYGHRARLAESNAGVDWKAMSHAVRVATEAIELLQTGKVTFPLPNADRVLAIKLGQVPYQEVTDEIEQLLVRAEELTLTSVLPSEADEWFARDLVLREYMNEVLQEAS